VENTSEFTAEEKALLFFCYDDCNQEKDPSFRAKWNSDLGNDLKNLFLWISGNLKITPVHDFNWYVNFLQSKGTLVQSHAYFGWLKNFGQLRRCFKSINRALWKKPQPKRWMGVGHRDTGTARDPAYDASPSWQEVAMWKKSRTNESN